MKTLAIRLEDEQHAHLTLLAKLSSESVTDVIRVAIEQQLETMAANPELSSKADELTVVIDREAAEQRAALAQLFGTTAPPRSRSKSQ